MSRLLGVLLNGVAQLEYDRDKALTDYQSAYLDDTLYRNRSRLRALRIDFIEQRLQTSVRSAKLVDDLQ